MHVKYQAIADDLRKKINEFEYKVNQSIPSELQLQKEYEVSRHTIRQAIAVLVNEGYLRKEKGSGTYVDNTFNQNQNSFTENKTIGVITTYVSDYIFPSIIRGIEKTLSKNGYSLLLASTNNDYKKEKECLEKMLNHNVQGLIIEPTKSNQYNPNLALYVQLKEQEVPIVMINAAYEELSVPKIVVNDSQVGYLATEHLITNNHQNILLVTKIDDLQGKYRMKGFIQACEQYKINFTSESIITFTTESRKEVIKQVLERVKEADITGIVCYNDDLANKISSVFKQHDIEIPKDISIVGNDNSTLSQIGTVPLTTIEHPKEMLGVDAANWILKSIQTGKVLEDIIYLPKLIKRESVKVIR